MAVPRANEFYKAVLEIVPTSADGLSVKKIVERISEHFSLTEEDIRDLVPSGTQSRVENRTYWSISKLKNAGLLEHPERGYSQITEKGLEFLASHKGEIQNSELNGLRAALEGSIPIVDTVVEDPNDITPDEQMARSHEQHQSMLADEVLDSLKGVSPPGFERLVSRLLSQMDYGEVVREQGYSGDGGIDGILNQGTLGLEKVYVQAKRYGTNQVREVEIRAFHTSLTANAASKGVFITTSSFAQQAKEVAKTLSLADKTIRLIDGQELAELMIKNGVGVITEITYEVKKLDANYFAEV